MYAHSERLAGVTRDRDLLVIYDRGVEWIEGYPLRSKGADDAYNSFQDFRGSTYIDLVYVDNSRELRKSIEQLGFRRGTSTLGIPSSNGDAESKVKITIGGGKTLLEQAGLPACMWPYVVRCWCFGNTQVRNGGSSWNMRHKKGQFVGPKIPFGAAVSFKQSPISKQNKSKFSPDSQVGVFFGYVLQPGGVWKSDFYVVVLADFVGV